MTRYYLAVIVINILFAAIFYFKLTDTGLSTKAFIFIGGLSVLMGLIFPFLVGFFNIYIVIGINLLIILLGTYHISKMEHSVSPGTQLENTDPALQVAAAAEDFIILDNLDEGDTAEEAVTEEIEDEEAAVEEVITEEIEDEEDTVEEAVTEEIEDEELEPETENNIEDRTVRLDDNLVGLPGLENIAQGEEIMISEQHGEEEVLELMYSYVDRGFDAKTAGKLDLAVKYFSSALDLNPPPDLHRMLIFDLYSMYRELGQYAAAKQCMEEFSGFMSDLSAEVTREIKTNIKYIEILQEMLNKANTPNLPFSKLPALITVSVEGKVNEWLNDTFNN
ncbi:hypothetical protein [Phosphitispora sp. TUW77]|uniref:hypothetical protein n=1 Tax=Phosphitispora sp. TUW77 TaxID=3152361 RepID=UPI003AB2E114